MPNLSRRGLRIAGRLEAVARQGLRDRRTFVPIPYVISHAIDGDGDSAMSQAIYAEVIIRLRPEFPRVRMGISVDDYGFVNDGSVVDIWGAPSLTPRSTPRHICAPGAPARGCAEMLFDVVLGALFLATFVLFTIGLYRLFQ